MTPEDRMSLIDAALDGDISDADFLKLEAELIVDAEVRQQYYRRLQLEILLEREAADSGLPVDLQAGVAPVDTRSIASAGRTALWVGILLAVAASVLFAITFANQTDERSGVASVDSSNVGDEPSASGFAVLSGQSGAVWSGSKISNGGLIPEGELHLESGLIHVELFSGVQMVIEGEAVFSIDSPMQVSMKSGRARAHVPEPAHGFRIRTNTGDVVDLGTEFTVDVDKEGSSVEVVEGEVELRPEGASVRRLRDGEALQLKRGGLLESTPRDASKLIGPTAFQTELAQLQSGQFQRWQAATEPLRHDPRVVGYYQMDSNEGWTRQVKNLADGRDLLAGDGAVVAADRTKDRWGRSGAALDFSRMGSRVRVTVPGEYRGLTLLCWVKINSLDRWYNSLFLTDGHEEREPHWQIMDDGRLFFSVKTPATDDPTSNRPQQKIYYSDPFWNTSLSGQWIMLCTVYDVDRQQVVHYVNDKAISQEAIEEEWLIDTIKIGAASICNWSEPMYRTDAKFVVRNLNGSLDEFAIFGGALSSDEVLAIFRSGNPHEQ